MNVRPLAVLACLVLAGCGPAAVPALGAYAGVEIASVALFHRGIEDLVVSAVSGRDCSIVRLDRGLSYCVPVDPPRPVPFCTRTLGRPQCFDTPAGLADMPRELADTPPLVAQP